VKVLLEKKAYRNEDINKYLIVMDDKSIVNCESHNCGVNSTNNNMVSRRNKINEESK
jgi:hypothetical protein